jgi:hypothetical protein
MLTAIQDQRSRITDMNSRSEDLAVSYSNNEVHPVLIRTDASVYTTYSATFYLYSMGLSPMKFYRYLNVNYHQILLPKIMSKILI